MANSHNQRNRANESAGDGSSARNGSPSFEAPPLRSRFEASMLERVTATLNRAVGEQKAVAIGAMSGTVVEIGAGTGANMEFYAPGIHLIAVEPNPYMHERLKAAADRHGVDMEIRSVVGERIDLDDATADGVVGTLVLCGVSDPAVVLAEIRRLLVPGGTYFFLEHVVAPSQGVTRQVQRLVKRPHRWMFNGCEVDRDATALIESAGFSHVAIERRDAGPAAAWTRHQIIGTATR